MNPKLLKKVLLVEDDPVFLKGMMYSIKQLGYEPILSDSGKDAVEKLKVHAVDAIVSDINMPNGNGLQLLNHVKKNYKIPVILMTGLSDLKEAQAAIDMGARSFLSKPFKKAELQDALEKCFTETESPVTSPTTEMIKLHLEEFLTGTKMDFNIYLKTSDAFLKVSSGGEHLSSEAVFDYRECGIDYLYTKKDEFISYLGLNAYVSAKIDTESKKELFASVSKCIEELSFLKQFNEAAFQRAQVHVEATMSILTDNNETQNLMMSIHQLGGHHFPLSIRVAFFTSLISQYMGNISTVDYFKLISAGLLHDLGISVRNLTGASELPEEIKLMIEEHTLNSGHAQRLTKILSMTKAFLTLPLSISEFPKTIEKFTVSSLGTHDLTVLQAFLLVFGLEMPQEFVEYQLSKLGA